MQDIFLVMVSPNVQNLWGYKLLNESWHKNTKLVAGGNARGRGCSSIYRATWIRLDC